MPWKELLDDIDTGLLAEHIAYTDVSEHDVSGVLRDRQKRLLDRLKKVGDTGDLETILLAEHSILSFEKKKYVNSTAMEASLNNALHEVKIALALVEKVREPEAYRTVDENFQLPKHRLGGLPRDEARDFFMSHYSRLTNHEKSRLRDIDKQIIRARKDNLTKARKSYISLQNNALAAPEPPESRLENRIS